MDYLRTNRVILSAVGLWPYQPPLTQKIVRCTFLSGAFSLHLPIIIKLIEVRHNFEDVLVCLPMAVTAIIFWINYAFFVLKTPTILNLLDSVSRDFETLQSFEIESEILHKSAEEGRLAVLTFAVYTGSSILMFCGMSYVAPLLDILLPLNETRPKVSLTEVDYVIFEVDDHYYFATVHSTIIGTMVMLCIVAVDLMLYSLVQHACGMFRVLWYRLHKISYMKDVNNNEMYREAISCVELYDDLLEFTDGIDSSFSIFLFVSLGIIIVMMSFQGAMMIIKMDDLDFVVKYGIYYAGLIIHLLYISIPGQKLIDHSNYMIFCVYDMEWYDMPLSIKKLLQMIMIRGLKESKVTIGQFSTLCIETYSSILRIIFQFLSVLTSTRT